MRVWGGRGMSSELMSFAELSRSIGARHYSFSNNTGFSSVAIDSRAVKEGSLFFALNGATFDGHKFIKKAFDSGANGAVVESAKLEIFDLMNTAKDSNKDLIVVENTLTALQNSARVYLEKFPKIYKIGITGSSGKTTTKEIVAAIISCEKNVVKNEGNLNSETGLPLSVFQVRDCHEVCVFELATSRHGEISALAEIVKPNAALITGIGSAHIEYFGTKLEILKEKRNIFNYLKDKDTALIPKNDQYSKELADGVSGKIKFYSSDNFEELEGTRSLGLEGTEITWAGEKIHFALPGKHNLDDAIAAIAIAKEVSVSNSSIKKGLESVKPLFGRFEVLKGRTTVICDCYNANPESTAKSVEFCDSVEWQGRKAYVIGDMLELGGSSFAEHEKLAELLLRSDADMIFLFGNEVKAAADFLAKKGRGFFYTNNIDELSAAIDRYVQTGDLVLLKGSRGCALERLTEMLVGEAMNVS